MITVLATVLVVGSVISAIVWTYDSIEALAWLVNGDDDE